VRIILAFFSLPVQYPAESQTQGDGAEGAPAYQNERNLPVIVVEERLHRKVDGPDIFCFFISSSTISDDLSWLPSG
jgi:hypothetical protein